MSRWIGPIPTRIIEPDDYVDDCMYHPGGPVPTCGGYRPVRVDMGWREFCALALESKTLKMWDDEWCAHTSPTRLRYRPEGWYVEAPSDRLAWRCVSIAMDAIRDGYGEAAVTRIGVTREEVRQAFIELNTDPVIRSDHDALESFPFGRHIIDGHHYVHRDGYACGPDCPQHELNKEG